MLPSSKVIFICLNDAYFPKCYKIWKEIWHTCGPPIINKPHGLIWITVWSSRYLAGITSLITFSLISFRSSSNEIFSLCWRDTTIVWTLLGMQAPWSKVYSAVTYNKFQKSYTVYRLRASNCQTYVIVLSISFSFQSFIFTNKNVTLTFSIKCQLIIYNINIYK